MRVKSIIRVDKPTVNKRIYHLSDLQKMIQYILPNISQNKCFIWFGNISSEEMTLDNAVGMVRKVEIDEGQAYFDIDLFDIPRNNLIRELYEYDKLLVDFYLDAKTLEEDENGNRHIDLSDMIINGLSLKLAQNCI